MTMDALNIRSKGTTPESPVGYERRAGGGVGRTMQPRQVLIYPCRPEGLGRPLRASINDLSSTGLGLVCLGRLNIGTRFVMRMAQPNGAPLLQVYHVIRCRDAGGGASMIGALFDQPFTDACQLSASGTSDMKTAC